MKRCYFAVKPRVVFATRQFLPSAKKDVLPSHHCSNLVYLFVCRCDSRYVGRTSQRLQECIKQHIPKFTISTNRKAFLVGVKPTILLGNFMSLLLVNIFLITLYVLLITMTTNFQFLPEVVLSFIFPP